jgi:hypothetical protein
MAPSFEAFEPSVVVDDFARKIDALCIWNDTIITSLSDGSLLFFQEQPAADQQGSAPTVSTWQVTRAQKGFTKRGAQQLHALESQQFLLSLSGEHRGWLEGVGGSPADACLQRPQCVCVCQ